jgi:hypothetical protein
VEGNLIGGDSNLLSARCAGASRLLESIVYQATPRDPLVIIAVVLTMGPVGIGAAYRPVRRALMLNPAEVLRQD